MVQVRVADQDVVDGCELVEREVTHARPGIDPHVVVDQKGSGSAAGSDGAGATEDADFHACIGEELAPLARQPWRRLPWAGDSESVPRC